MAAVEEIREEGLATRLFLLLRLAAPTMLSRAGIMIMALVDIVMVGRHSTQELAYASLGMSLFIPVLVTGIGLVQGVAFITAEHYGAGRFRECGAVWRRGLPWALLIGSIGAGLLAFGEMWLTLFGHSPELAAGGGAVAWAVALAIPAQLLYVCCAFHLEATRRPIPGMIAMLAANILNGALNWVFIYGNFGAPELGAVGAAWSTTAVRLFLFVVLFVYIVTRFDRAVYGVRLTVQPFWGKGGWRAGARMRSVGYGAGASYAVETSGFAAILQLAGSLGATTLAAYSIAHNLESTFFMIALGLAAATAVLVGNALGARDIAGAEAAGRLGVFMILLLMTVFAALVVAFTPAIVQLYTRDPALQALATPILLVTAAACIFDGAQLVAGQAVRALGDVWGTTVRQAVAFLVVMAPLGYVLGVVFGFGGVGLMSAVVVGVIVSFWLNWRRFRRLCAVYQFPDHMASGAT